MEITMKKLVLAAALAALTTPAFAQAPAEEYGSGNIDPYQTAATMPGWTGGSYRSYAYAPGAYGSYARARTGYGSYAYAPRAYGSYARAPGAYDSYASAPGAYDSYARAPLDAFGFRRDVTLNPQPVYSYGKYRGQDPDPAVRLDLERDILDD